MPADEKRTLDRPLLNSVRGLSFRNRIIVLSAVFVILATSVIGIFSYQRVKALATEIAEIKLRTQAELLSQRFTLDYNLIAEDLKTASLSKTFLGIARSLRNGGTDPVDGTDISYWTQRAIALFKAIQLRREAYFQVRYIMFEDGGRELVRVDRTDSGFSVVDGDLLQRKGDEPYFQQALTAKAGEVVFSDVTYNREFGSVDPSRRTAIRGMLPIFDEEGKPFGFLVINVDYKRMLQDAFSEIDPDLHTYFVNGSGDYMEHWPEEAGGKGYELHLASEPDHETPPLIKAMVEFGEERGLSYTDDNIAYFIRSSGAFNQASAHLGVAVEAPRDVWLAPVWSTVQQMLLIGALIMAIATIAAVYAARVITQPLTDLTRLVRGGSRDQRGLALMPGRTDELGELARAIEVRTNALIDSRARASAIINNVVDGLILIDDRGVIEAFNPSCERMFGYSMEEAIGQNVKILMPKAIADEHDGYLERNRRGEGGRMIDRTQELEAVDKHGRVFPIELAISSLKLDGVTKFSAVIRDISERKEIERVHREFVSTVSHELRTPLTSIRGSLTLVETLAKTDLSKQCQKLIALAQKNTERLTLLVNDILDFEKIKSGKPTYNLSDVNVNAAILQSIDLNEGYAENYGVTLSAELSEEDPHIQVDANRFQQVLSNLISNAMKFSHEGGTVVVRSTLIGGACRIEVVDRGVGIPKGFAAKIFEPFSQVDSSDARSKGGSGLGLNITKSFVEGMNGEIGFISVKEEGTTFWMVFPASASASMPKSYLRSLDSSKVSALHLEDDDDFHAMLQASWGDQLDLVHAKTIEEAKRLLRMQDFDIVFIDRLLDDGDGLDLIEFIPDPGQTKIVVVTAVDEPVDLPQVDMTFVKSRSHPDHVTDSFAKLIRDVQNRRIERDGTAAEAV